MLKELLYTAGSNIVHYLFVFYKIKDILFNCLEKIKPHPTFLSDVAAFIGVIIGLSIPFSINIIIRVAEKYESEVIPKRFKNECIIKAIPYYFLVVIFWTILLRFFFTDKFNPIIWSITAIFTLLFLLIGLILFTLYIRRVIMYALDKKVLKKELIKDIRKSRRSLNQLKYLQAIEAYGDIAVFETNSSNYEKVLEESLPFLEENIVDLVSGDLNKKEKLLLHPEYFKTLAKESEEAKFRLYFNPQEYLIGFATALNQINRIYLAGLEKEHDYVLSRNAVQSIIRILKRISSQTDKHIFVEQLLQRLQVIMRNSLVKKDLSMYTASIHWYTDIVFNPLDKKGNFQLSYLPLFDKYFFSAIRYIVAEGHTAIFQSLISFLVDGIHIPDYYRGEIYKYGHLILRKSFHKYYQLDTKYAIKRRIKELADSENDLFTQENLKAWLKKFEELKTIIEQELNEEQKRSALELEDKIKQFVYTRFKYHNLLEIVFAIGAYCLFKQRYDYIRFLWEYKQPPDSDAKWIGHDVVPRALSEVIELYFRKGIFEKEFDFWEGHHGNKKYFKQYFLLLLAKILQNVEAINGMYPQIEKFRLPDLYIYRLNDFLYSIDEFVAMSTELKESRNVLVKIGLDSNKLDEIFDKKLILFLEKLKSEAEKQISAKLRRGVISHRGLNEFKQEVVKSFYKNAILRDIFKKYFKTYEDKTREKDSKITCHGIEITYQEIEKIDDKAAFLDEWHVDYVGLGENYGEDLATGEDYWLLDIIARNCDEIRKQDFEATLERFENPDNIVIFATIDTIWRFFEDLKSFKPKWHQDTKQLDVKGFSGWYDFNGKLIPVFETYHHKLDKQILILNKSKVGQLIQLSPIINENKKEELIEDIFYIDIQAFSDNDALMEKYINDPPEWLKEYGDEQIQREYLQTCVIIKIFERLEYIKPDDFEGFKLLLSED